MKKVCLKLLFSLIFLGTGLVIGYTLYSAQWKCVDFVYKHHHFYSVFAQKLAHALQQRGYMTHCPNILPRTKIYFLQTGDTVYYPALDDNPKNAKIAFLGDCTDVTPEMAYLYKFDALLSVDKFQNGYISSFNLRTAHFPLNDKEESFCHTHYKEHQIDVKQLARRLDDIIQGVRHEKF